MELARILIQALLVVAAMTVLDRVNDEHTLPGISAVLALTRYGAFAPFAASLTASANNYKGAIIAILAVTLLIGWPTTTQALAEQLTPVGVGVIFGALTQKLIQDGR